MNPTITSTWPASSGVEKLVRGYTGAVVIISHDRYLLDQCVDRIAELDRGRISTWYGTYSSYAVQKQLATLRQEQLYKAQQKRIVQIETAIKRFELWASIVVDERHARQARARYKMLERMDKIEQPGELRRIAAGTDRLAGQQQGTGNARRGQMVHRPGEWRREYCPRRREPHDLAWRARGVGGTERRR